MKKKYFSSGKSVEQKEQGYLIVVVGVQGSRMSVYLQQG
jgi:hypothetical protein